MSEQEGGSQNDGAATARDSWPIHQGWPSGTASQRGVDVGSEILDKLSHIADALAKGTMTAAPTATMTAPTIAATETGASGSGKPQGSRDQPDDQGDGDQRPKTEGSPPRKGGFRQPPDDDPGRDNGDDDGFDPNDPRHTQGGTTLYSRDRNGREIVTRKEAEHLKFGMFDDAATFKKVWAECRRECLNNSGRKRMVAW